MSVFQKLYFGLLMLFSILCFYAVGAWADTLWATCTDGKTINKCKLQGTDIYINGRRVDAVLHDVILLNDEIKILYEVKK